MNYEELIAARNAGTTQKVHLPIGEFYRVRTDGKWHNVVDIDQELSQSIVFTKGLEKECDVNPTLVNVHQIHFSPEKDAQGNTVRLELEQGTFMPMSQMLAENPALMASENFVENTIDALADLTTYLHAKGIRHVCYSPRTVMIRKGSGTAMLLNHGSFYKGMSQPEDFYGDDVRFIAPEVIENGSVDDRSDVYSLGRFMESLFDKDEVPREYRKVIKKATAEKPEDRYNSPADLAKDMHRRREARHTLTIMAVALIIAAIIVYAYFDSFPEATQIEYVKPAPRQATDDLLDDGFAPEELGVVSADSLSEDDWERHKDYQAKAEEIFRKRYEAEADRILSQIYTKEYMSNSEKKFMAESESTIQQLMKAQEDISSEVSIEPSRAQLIASEIIERLTEQKKKQIGSTNSRGIQN